MGGFFFVQYPRKGGVFQTWVRAWYTRWLGMGGPGMLTFHIHGCPLRGTWTCTRAFSAPRPASCCFFNSVRLFFNSIFAGESLLWLYCERTPTNFMKNLVSWYVKKQGDRVVMGCSILHFRKDICVNSYWLHPSYLISPSAAHMHRWTGSALVQVKACRLFGAKPLPEPILTYCQLHP